MSLGQLSLWKVLVAVLLVVPPVAYVARDLSTATQDPAPRSAVVLPASGPAPIGPRIKIDKERPPEPEPDPTPPPAPKPPPGQPPGTQAADGCSDEERDDGVLVVHPCPDDVGDDDDDDDDERDDDGGGDDD